MFVTKLTTGETSRSSWILITGLGMVKSGASLTSTGRIVKVLGAERLSSGRPGRDPAALPLSIAMTSTKIGEEFRALTSVLRV